MKQGIFLWVAVFGLMAGCTSGIRNEGLVPPDEVLSMKGTAAEKPEKSPGNNRLIIENEKDIIGYWVGMFEPDTNAGYIAAGEGFYWDYANKINIAIEKIWNDTVYGHSVVAGNNRSFTGTMTLTDNVYSFTLKEPGDNKYDGSFRFTIRKDDSLLTGNWSAFKKIRIPVRKFELQKMIFTYDPGLSMDYGRYVNWEKHVRQAYNDTREDSDYDIAYFTTTDNIGKYNASAQVLPETEVRNMKKGDLFIIRNAIYARHGYSFKNRQLRVYFDKQSWYVPVSTDVKSEFTETEKKNIELLLRYEKHAKEYYDVFGRG